MHVLNNYNSELSTARIIETLIARRSSLKEDIAILDKALKKAPTGSLRIGRSKSYRQYFQRFRSSDSRGIYIQKSNFALAKALAQKEYDRKVIDVLRGEHSALCDFLEKFHPEHVDEIFRLLSVLRKSLVTPIRMIDEEYIEQWLRLEYEKKGFAADAPELLTSRNLRVRSKSEIMIAEGLYRYKIPFRYEFPIQIYEHGMVYPDFQCLDLRTRTVIIWEHFGMMSDPAYAEQVARKLEKYNKADFYIGYNLIVTFETNNQPLNSKEIEQTIKRYFC